MCGICGSACFDANGSTDPELLPCMTNSMVHRGPDSGAFFRAPGVGLGIHRLSIIDLETDDQPISSVDGNITIVCNGEIYNHPELRLELDVVARLLQRHRRGEQSYGQYLMGVPGIHLWDELFLRNLPGKTPV